MLLYYTLASYPGDNLLQITNSVGPCHPTDSYRKTRAPVSIDNQFLSPVMHMFIDFYSMVFNTYTIIFDGAALYKKWHSGKLNSRNIRHGTNNDMER